MKYLTYPLAILFFASDAVASVGHVSKLSGTAEAIRAQQPITLSEGSLVHAGDTIRTAEDGIVEIIFADDSHFTVGRASQIVIDEFVYDAASHDGVSGINVLKGAFRFSSGKIGKKNPAHVRYNTPVSVIGIRGSQAFGEVKPAGQTLLGMEECCIDVISHTGTMALDTVNTFSQITDAYALPSYPAQCNAAWLNKTAKALGATEDDGIYGQADSVAQTLMQGQYQLNFRYRMEHVDDDAFARNSLANTLRSAIGYKTARYHGMSAFAELEHVSRLDDDHYNDTLNGRTDRPIIADTDSTELSQLYLAYEGLFDTHAAIGRQSIVYDNSRFVGASSFRQDGQTFDAVTLHDMHLPNTNLRYAYIGRVHTNLPDSESAGRRDSDSHLLNASYGGFPIGTITAYGYLLDLKDTPVLSSQTYGVRLAGSQRINTNLLLDYALEYAHQHDYADNPISYHAPYFHANGMAHMAQFELGAGYERIGSDESRASVQFPIATKHTFNGEADKFSVTPTAGLIDAYVQAGYILAGNNPPLKGIKLTAAYHEFSAEDGAADYGNEWNAGINLPFMTHYNADLRIARYHAKDLYSDTQKIWFTLSASF